MSSAALLASCPESVLASALEGCTTSWATGDQNPDQPGLYQRHAANGLIPSFWDGADWHEYILSAGRCLGPVGPSAHRFLPWRGLRARPARGLIVSPVSLFRRFAQTGGERDKA